MKAVIGKKCPLCENISYELQRIGHGRKTRYYCLNDKCSRKSFVAKREKIEKPKCIVCGEKALVKCFCSKHYQKIRRIKLNKCKK